MGFVLRDHVAQLVNTINSFQHLLVNFYESIDPTTYKNQYLEIRSMLEMLNVFSIYVPNPNPYSDARSFQQALDGVMRGSFYQPSPKAVATRFLEIMYATTKDELTVARLKAANFSPELVDAALAADLQQKFPQSASDNLPANLHPEIAAKCKHHFVNGHFDDAVSNSMKAIEEKVRSIAKAQPTDVGAKLMSNAMTGSTPTIELSGVSQEQEGFHSLFRGAMQAFRNRFAHHTVGENDPQKTFEILAFASLLMRLLEGAKIHPSQPVTPP